MAVQTLLVGSAHDADYFQNEMFPDKVATTGHFVAIAEDAGVPFVNWTKRLPISYQSGEDITIRIDWASLTATSGDIVWQVEIERLTVEGHPLNASNFDTPQEDTDTVSLTLSSIARSTIVFTQAQFDDIEPGDSFRLRLTRNTADIDDTLIGDAVLVNWSLESDVDD